MAIQRLKNLVLSTTFYLGKDFHGNPMYTTISEILDLLQERYPGGFRVREATPYLESRLGGPINTGLVDRPSFYKSLLEAGFLTVLPKEVKTNENYYLVNPEISGEAPIPNSGKDFNIPRGLRTLINGYSRMTGQPHDFFIGELEQQILTDSGFLSAMKDLKLKNPEKYASSGGKYLDKLDK